MNKEQSASVSVMCLVKFKNESLPLNLAGKQYKEFFKKKSGLSGAIFSGDDA